MRSEVAPTISTTCPSVTLVDMSTPQGRFAVCCGLEAHSHTSDAQPWRVSFATFASIHMRTFHRYGYECAHRHSLPPFGSHTPHLACWLLAGQPRSKV